MGGNTNHSRDSSTKIDVLAHRSCLAGFSPEQWELHRKELSRADLCQCPSAQNPGVQIPQRRRDPVAPPAWNPIVGMRDRRRRFRMSRLRKTSGLDHQDRKQYPEHTALPLPAVTFAVILLYA